MKRIGPLKLTTTTIKRPPFNLTYIERFHHHTNTNYNNYYARYNMTMIYYICVCIVCIVYSKYSREGMRRGSFWANKFKWVPQANRMQPTHNYMIDMKEQRNKPRTHTQAQCNCVCILYIDVT